MAGKHRPKKGRMGIGDIVLYGAVIALGVTVLSFILVALGGSR